MVAFEVKDKMRPGVVRAMYHIIAQKPVSLFAIVYVDEHLKSQE